MAGCYADDLVRFSPSFGKKRNENCVVMLLTFKLNVKTQLCCVSWRSVLENKSQWCQFVKYPTTLYSDTVELTTALRVTSTRDRPSPGQYLTSIVHSNKHSVVVFRHRVNVTLLCSMETFWLSDKQQAKKALLSAPPDLCYWLGGSSRKYRTSETEEFVYIALCSQYWSASLLSPG